MKKNIITLFTLILGTQIFVSAEDVCTDCIALQGTTHIVKITSISFNANELTINPSASLSDRQYQLTASISPVYADLDVISWTSSNNSLATVTQNGLVEVTYSTSSGSATQDVIITASTADGLSASCTIHLVYD